MIKLNCGLMGIIEGSEDILDHLIAKWVLFHTRRTLGMLRVYNICLAGLIFNTTLPRTFGILVSAVSHHCCRIKGSPEYRGSGCCCVDIC